MSSLTKIPAGVQYFFDEEVKLRRHVERQAMAVFAGWSYDEIILPMFDYHDLFARGMGAEIAERTYRFTDRDGALLALRPELTSLVARTVATRFKAKPRPLRLCYSGEVFRYDEPSERAAREFHQVGVEHIGEPNIVADVEVLLVAAELLSTLGLNGFRIALSHADFFNGVSGYLELEAAQRAELRRLIDRRNSQALDTFLQQHAPSVEATRRAGFCRLTQLAGGEEVLAQAEQVLRNKRSLAAIAHLRAVYTTLAALGLAEHFDVDFGDTGGQEYYTGLLFKAYVPEWNVAVGTGGRYDKLIENFGAAEPAVGFSFALDALAGALSKHAPNGQMDTTALVQSINFNGDLAATFTRARTCRQAHQQVKISAQQ
ncbi:MAG: ATP phosphoribosyltransferase regulatory subunit [Acidobacteria bacterium]|nr:ATP phosphoribosyltransferase regulatory subunit [Acidobacteriota bacterium]MBI3426104.1 ATP phosphoribosyltransferase regulatory subunit [Acidobacteriota bacterium]